MSIDAIDASKPHSEDNIQWVCLHLNRGKWKFADRAYREWASAVFRR
jgi:hypothetical protein